MPEIRLKPREDRRIRAGHRWVFSNEIAAADASIPDGGVGELRDARGGFLGMAYLNRHSLIAARILTRSRREIDAGFIASRVRDALELRQRVLPDGRFGRMIHGESDGLPGLVVDRYDSTLVVQVGTRGMEALWPFAEAALREQLAPGRLYLRSDASTRALEGLQPNFAWAFGEENGAVEVLENGAVFATDVVRGQKTGWFYDQRDNRAQMQGRVEGARVLDAFCYAGAWSVLAAKWGAASVTGLDSSAFALELADANAAKNGVAEKCTFRKADVFDELRRLESANERYDVVVLDPPALIKSRARIAEGVRGYHELNVQAMKLLTQHGTLFSCSCSNLLPREEFQPLLSRAAHDAKAQFRLADLRGQAPDHPVLLAMRETEYLKCAVLERL